MGAALKEKQDQCGGSLPYIDTEFLGAKAYLLRSQDKSLGSRSPNLSTTRIPMEIGLLIKQGLLVQEGFTWLCLGVLIRQGLLVQEGFALAEDQDFEL